MATPELVTVRDFTTSRYGQLADNIEAPLTDILARAEAVVQTRIGRRLLLATYTERFRPRVQTIYLRNRPIVAITSVKRRALPDFAWETLSPSYYTFEAGAGYIEPTKTVLGYEVEIVYSAGYAVVPEDLKEAILTQAVLFSYQDLEVYGSGDSRNPGILYMADQVNSIIDRYRATATVFH